MRWNPWPAVAALTVMTVLGSAVVGAHRAPVEATAAAPAVVTLAASESTSDTTLTDVVDTGALEAIDTDARFAVAVLDLASGQSFSHGDTGTFDTASIVKVNVLAALLAAQGGELTAAQLESATAMIERSDNASASDLFAQVGGVAGMETYNAGLGLVDTTIDSSWGLTQTTPRDQLVIVQDALQHDVVRDLMGDVVDAQRFGVSAAADDPQEAVLKVGYLQRSSTGWWDVTSIGEVVSDGRTYVVAILSDQNLTVEAGVELVDAIAVASVAAFDAG